MKQRKGLIYNGWFWPLYGGGVLFNSKEYFHGGREDICPTLRAEKNDAAVCVEWDDGKDD